VLDPIYTAISWILLRWHDLLGLVLNKDSGWTWTLSIVLLVITLRIILFPLFVKQIRSQRAMQELQPKLKVIQERHKGDRQTQQAEMMKLYKEHKVNPLMGCLPLLLQAPVFLSLFHVLRRINPTKTHVDKSLYGWTANTYDSAAHAKLFGVAPIAAAFKTPTHVVEQMGAPSGSGWVVKVVAAVLVIVMCATTYISTRQMMKRSGPTADPQQRMIQNLMMYFVPLSLLVSGLIFPLGVIIYWVTNNLWSMGQQFWVLKTMPPPGGPAAAKAGKAEPAEKPAAKTLAPRPGVKPTNPKKGGTAKPPVDTAKPDGDATPADGTPDLKKADAPPEGSANGAGGGTAAKKAPPKAAQKAAQKRTAQAGGRAGAGTSKNTRRKGKR
jgi:YidC/Oxa1 family membrane protein insertase